MAYLNTDVPQRRAYRIPAPCQPNLRLSCHTQPPIFKPTKPHRRFQLNTNQLSLRVAVCYLLARNHAWRPRHIKQLLSPLYLLFTSLFWMGATRNWEIEMAGKGLIWHDSTLKGNKPPHEGMQMPLLTMPMSIPNTLYIPQSFPVLSKVGSSATSTTTHVTHPICQPLYLPATLHSRHPPSEKGP